MGYRRAAGAFTIVLNPDDHVLVLHRTATHPTYPNRWTLPGGRVEEGETSHGAATSELVEETGIAKKRLRFLKRRRVRGVNIDYFVTRVGSPQVELDDEHDAYRWVPCWRVARIRCKDDVLLAACALIGAYRNTRGKS